MFDYYRYTSNHLARTHRDTDPYEIGLFVYSDGRCRLNRRGRDISIDSWYASFDAVAPILAAMTAQDRYILNDVTVPEALDVDVRCRLAYASYCREVPYPERQAMPFWKWHMNLDVKHPDVLEPIF